MLQDIYDYYNSGVAPARVVVEPWNVSYDVAPGESLRFVAASMNPGVFEAELDEGVTILSVWSGATLEVFRDGRSIAYHDSTMQGEGYGRAPESASGSLFSMI